MPSILASEYFSRNLGALHQEQQQHLTAQRVAVIGCGGLGAYVIEELVRIGVGQIFCCDPDVFTPSNCNRQLNALSHTLGRNKAEVAAERARQIHPFCTISPYPADFRTLAEDTLFTVEAVIDCLDSVQSRHELAAVCLRRKLPLVHGAVEGWYGQVGVQLPGDDLLARLYPERNVAPMQSDKGTVSVLACTVGLVASLQVAEVLKLLVGIPSPLTTAWMHLDLKNAVMQIIPHCPADTQTASP
jgi:molybdopterin/thiamine biosynthesis adenylyltransferase